MICNFGKHKGTPYTRIPVSYLLWMVNVNHRQGELAKRELKRRGTVVPNLEISGHAIDRASQRCLDIWQSSHMPNEGLHAWLIRMSNEALEKGQQYKKDHYVYNGINFVFEQDGIWPVLKTVVIAKADICTNDQNGI